MQVEYIARVRLASWRTVEQQGKGAVRYCEQPAYGAIYCSGADSDAVAATMQV